MPKSCKKRKVRKLKQSESHSDKHSVGLFLLFIYPWKFSSFWLFSTPHQSIIAETLEAIMQSSARLFRHVGETNLKENKIFIFHLFIYLFIYLFIDWFFGGD